MPISVTCPSCGHQTQVPDSAAGMRGKCPKCGGKVKVPGAEVPPVVDAEVLDPDIVAPVAPAPGSIALEPEPGGSAPDEPRRPCPACGEMIAPGALKCRFCNEIFDPKLKAQTARTTQRSFMGGEGENLTAVEVVFAVLCSGIGCIMGIIWMVQGKPKGKKMFLISILMAIFWTIVRFAAEAATQNLR